MGAAEGNETPEGQDGGPNIFEKILSKEAPADIVYEDE